MKYDIIIVLCPSKKNKEGKFPEFLNGEYLGGQTRMDAAVEIYKENEKARFILVGGYNEDNGITDYYRESQKTTDMEEYMIDNGVEKNNIRTVNSLPCTRHNLIAIFNTYKKKLDGRNIGLLTNFYHMARALRFWTKLVKEIKEFMEIQSFPKSIIAESIIGGGERYIRYCEYISTLEGEIKGLIDIEKNLYRDNCFKLKEEKEYKYKRVIKKEFERIIGEDENYSILLTSEERKEFGF